MVKSPEKTERGAQPSLSIDGTRLKLLRENKKLTQLYVASVVGVTTDTISRWENNRYPSIRRDNALKLAAALEVDLQEIVRREEGPVAVEEQPPPVSPRPRRVPLLLGTVFTVLVLAGAFYLGRMLLADPAATRWVPRYAAPGSIIPVQIKLEQVEQGSKGFLIKETLPTGWRLVRSLPSAAAVEAGGGGIKWLVTGGGGSVYYTVQLPSAAPPGGGATVKGDIVLYADGDSRSQKIAGDGRITVGEYHWADTNGDRRIDDDEIMPAYYVCEAMKDFGLDWKVIEAIWSAKGYRWDPKSGYRAIK